MTDQQFFQVPFFACICLGGFCWIVWTMLDIRNERRKRERIARILDKDGKK